MVLYKYIYIGVTMSKFYVGQRVKYIANDADGKFYPPAGTLGTVKDASICLLLVEWDSGTIPGKWICYTYDVIPAEDIE